MGPVPVTCSGGLSPGRAESNAVATGQARAAATNRTANGTKARAAWTNRATRISSRFAVQNSGRLIKRLDVARRVARRARDGGRSRSRGTGGRSGRGSGRRERGSAARAATSGLPDFRGRFERPGRSADPPRPSNEKDFGCRDGHVSSPGFGRPSKPCVGPEIAPAAGPRQRNCCPASAWDDPEKSFLRPVRLETWGILRF